MLDERRSSFGGRPPADGGRRIGQADQADGRRCGLEWA